MQKAWWSATVDCIVTFIVTNCCPGSWRARRGCVATVLLWLQRFSASWESNETNIDCQNKMSLVSFCVCEGGSHWRNVLQHQHDFRLCCAILNISRLLTLCASLAHHPESLVQKVWTEYSPGQQQPSVAQSCLQHVRDIKQGAPLHLPEVPVNLTCTPPLLEGNPYYITLDMIILHIKANNHQWMDQMESSIQWNQKPKYEKISK